MANDVELDCNALGGRPEAPSSLGRCEDVPDVHAPRWHDAAPDAYSRPRPRAVARYLLATALTVAVALGAGAPAFAVGGAVVGGTTTSTTGTNAPTDPFI